VIASASGSIRPAPAQGSEVLVKAEEREALVTFERLLNVMDAQGLQECILYNYDRMRCVGTCQVQESAYSPCTRVLPSVEYRVILIPCVLRETDR